MIHAPIEPSLAGCSLPVLLPTVRLANSPILNFMLLCLLDIRALALRVHHLLQQPTQRRHCDEQETSDTDTHVHKESRQPVANPEVLRELEVRPIELTLLGGYLGEETPGALDNGAVAVARDEGRLDAQGGDMACACQYLGERTRMGSRFGVGDG